MINLCQANECKDEASGQQKTWCLKHRKMVPRDLATRIFNAWASGSDKQSEAIEEARLEISKAEKEST